MLALKPVFLLHFFQELPIFYSEHSVKLTSQFEAIGGVMSVREVIGGVMSVRGDLAPGTTGESVNLLANTRQLGGVKIDKITVHVTQLSANFDLGEHQKN